jgi:hypothetical protein
MSFRSRARRRYHKAVRAYEATPAAHKYVYVAADAGILREDARVVNRASPARRLFAATVFGHGSGAGLFDGNG